MCSIVEGYCFRCRAMRSIMDMKKGVTANKRKIYKGKCPECFGNVSRMGGITDLDDDPQE